MRKIALYLLPFIALNACNANKYVYSPSTANLLKLEEKNDVKVAVNYSTVGSLTPNSSQNKHSNGIDVQSAYAVNNKIALKFDAYSKSENNQSGLINDVIRQKITYQKRGIELSGGYYNLKQKDNITSFQALFGMALGKSSFKEINNGTVIVKNYFYDINFNKFFIQPAVNFKVSNNYTITLATKFSLVSYYNAKTNYPDLSKEALGYIETKPSFFWDFIVQNEFGFKGLNGIHFQTQIGSTTLSSNFNIPNATETYKSKYEYNNVWFMIGAVADIRKLLNKK
jgi:hypothetical protein